MSIRKVRFILSKCNKLLCSTQTYTNIVSGEFYINFGMFILLVTQLQKAINFTEFI